MEKVVKNRIDVGFKDFIATFHHWFIDFYSKSRKRDCFEPIFIDILNHYFQPVLALIVNGGKNASRRF